MKKLVICSLLMLMISWLMIMLFPGPNASYAFQDRGRATPTPSPTPSPKGSRPTPTPSTPRASAPSPPAAVSELTIKTALPGCAVLLDSKPRGTTDQNGLLNLPKLTPGTHLIIVSKLGYQPAERQVELNARQSHLVEVTLRPLPVSLSISPNVAGAKVEVSGRSYTDRVTELQLQPGQYQIRVSKPGYRTVARTIEVQPSATPVDIPIMLERVSAEEMLQQAEQDFLNGRHDQVIATCKDILATNAEQPRANRLLGQSYFNSERYAESVAPLAKAIALGEQVTIPVKHHHTTGITVTLSKNDGFCSGQFILRKGTLEFQSKDDPAHSFSVAPNKLYELKTNTYKKNVARLDTKVGRMKGSKEDKQDFNFLAAQSSLSKRDPNIANSVMDVSCNNCQPTIDALYQLLRQLKQ